MHRLIIFKCVFLNSNKSHVTVHETDWSSLHEESRGQANCPQTEYVVTFTHAHLFDYITALCGHKIAQADVVIGNIMKMFIRPNLL